MTMWTPWVWHRSVVVQGHHIDGLLQVVLVRNVLILWDIHEVVEVVGHLVLGLPFLAFALGVHLSFRLATIHRGTARSCWKGRKPIRAVVVGMVRASTTETRSWARAGSFGLALVLSFGSLSSSFDSIHIIVSSGCSDFCHSLSCSFEGLCRFLSQRVGLLFRNGSKVTGVLLDEVARCRAAIISQPSPCHGSK